MNEISKAILLSRKLDEIHKVDISEKLEEEVDELNIEIQNKDKDRILDEMGDVLFLLARILNENDLTFLTFDDILRNTNEKIKNRLDFAMALNDNEFTLEEKYNFAKNFKF